MTVEIPPEFTDFVQGIIADGGYESEAEVVGEALQLLKKRELLRQEVKAGVEQLDRGQYTEYGEDSLPEFLENIKAAERDRHGQEHGAE